MLPLVRTIVFVWSTLAGLAVIGMSAHIISVVGSFATGPYFQYAALGLATGLLTILSLPAMLMISIARKGALTSYIVVEFCWLSFLWIMWVATAGDVASTSSLWIGACDRAYGAAATFCDETKAIEALGFVTWFIIMAYSITLLIFAVMSAMRGHSSIWTNSVRQADFNAPAVVSAPVQPSYEVKMDNTGISQFSAPQGQFAAPQTQYPPYNAGTPVSGYGGTPQVQQQPMSPYPQV